MTAAGEPAPLVVGLGNDTRGDDAVGLVVARRVAQGSPAGVDVVELEDPMNLVDLVTGRGIAVLVDAVTSGRAPGVVTALMTGQGHEPLPERAWRASGRGGTHSFGPATAVELARVLGRLPERVVVVGVEAGCFDHGAPLSAAVADAVPEATARVLAALGR